MTIDTYRTYLNRLALVEMAPGMSVLFRLIDVSSAFGRVDAHITPVSGDGVTKVKFSRLVFVNEGVSE